MRFNKQIPLSNPTKKFIEIISTRFAHCFPCLWFGGAIRDHRFAQKSPKKGFFGVNVFFSRTRLLLRSKGVHKRIFED